jgi:hypothetical protein
LGTKNKKEGIIELQIRLEAPKKLSQVVIKIQRPIATVSSLLFPKNDYSIECKMHKRFKNGIEALYSKKVTSICLACHQND